MKKLIVFLFCTALVTTTQLHAQTFAEWFKQTKTQKKYLLLQIAKLQVYLGLLKDGYKLANDGLNLYRDIRNGDWLQHLGFVDHLTTISPAVSSSPKVAAILKIVRQANQSYNTLMPGIRSAPMLKSQAGDIDAVFQNILSAMTLDVNQLNKVLAASALSMSDEQRLKAIDRIYTSVWNSGQAFESFVQDCSFVEGVRTIDAADIERMQGWH